MTASTERDPRYHSLDLWRALIALWVVVEHASIALQFTPEGPGAVEGWVRVWVLGALRLCLGAPLFFVISGYCVLASADSARRRGTSVAAFQARRFWRIVPTYWAALLVFVGCVLALDAAGLGHWHRNGGGLELPSPRHLDLGQWLGNLTLTETWRPRVFWGREASVYTGVAWSLCYQEQFFAVCALILLVAPGRLYGALAVVTAAAGALSLAASDAGSIHRLDGTFLVRWHEFAVGLAVYWRLNRARSRAERRGVELGLGALLALALATGLTSTAATAVFGLALIALRPWDARVKGLALLGPLRACGRRSYSLYLTHVPVCLVVGASLRSLGVTSFWGLALVGVPAMVAASVAVSWAFFRHVERRFSEPAPARRPSAGPQPPVLAPRPVGPALLPA